MNKINAIRYLLRSQLINNHNKKNLLQEKFTLISNDCTAGMIYHDLGMRFESPLINMYMDASDYIKFLENLKLMLEKPFIEINSNYEYPMASLGGEVKIHLVHYTNFEEAKRKWNERKKRLDFNNLYIMMNNRNGCTDDIAKKFDILPYKNKIFFTNKKKHNLKYGYYIPHFDDKKCVGVMVNYISKLSIKRYYDYFNYVDWINNGD